MNSIEARHVSVRYAVGNFKGMGLKEFLIRRAKKEIRVHEKWALTDISFTLGKGELLGIIGSNGSGKSTLLKVLAGIIAPSKGKISIQGRMAPLLELGAGFDQEITVKENIFLRGALLGYTKKYMTEEYPRILEFSELAEYENEAFKRLSSGMKSKLAFSIASMVQPDILVLDEVLSVGDIAFKRKSEKKMLELIHSGITTILVSHSLAQVRQVCTKVLWIEQGKMMGIGPVDEMCSRYQEYMEHR